MPLDINHPCPPSPAPFHQAAAHQPAVPLDAVLTQQAGETASPLPSLAEEWAWEWFVADFKQQTFAPDPDDPASNPDIELNGSW